MEGTLYKQVSSDSHGSKKNDFVRIQAPRFRGNKGINKKKASSLDNVALSLK